MAVRPFRCCKNALCHRATYRAAEALKQLLGRQTLALPHESEARTADILKSIPDAEVAQPVKPCREAIHSEAAERRLKAELHAGWHLLIRNQVNVLEPERRWVGRHLRPDKTKQVSAQVRNG